MSIRFSIGDPLLIADHVYDGDNFATMFQAVMGGGPFKVIFAPGRQDLLIRFLKEWDEAFGVPDSIEAIWQIYLRRGERYETWGPEHPTWSDIHGRLVPMEAP